MDPYVGLTIGEADEGGSWWDDYGMGLTGIGLQIGAEYMVNRGGYLPFVSGKNIGPYGVNRMMRTARARGAVGRGMSNTYARMFNNAPNITVRGAQLQYTRLKRDLFRRNARGTRIGRGTHPLAQLYNQAGGNFKTLQNRYGTGAAARIWGVTQLGKLVRTTGILSVLSLGADLGTGLANAIMNYEPPELVSRNIAPTMGMPMIDTRAAFTQRQASLMAIHNSGLQARAALGNEAALMMG